MSGLSGKYVIAGIGATSFGKHEGRSTVSLNVEAVRQALADAGIEKDRVDGLFIKGPTSQPEMLYATRVAEALGIQPNVGGAWDQGGAANITLISFAIGAMEAGGCEVAVITFADNPRTGSAAVFSRPRGDSAVNGMFGTLAGYGMIMRRHIEQWATPAEAFAEVAIAARRHGAANPLAQVRNPLTMEDYLAAPYLIDPLRRDDCALVSDGGAAIVVMRADTAKKLGVAAPVPILGFGYGQTFWDVAQRPDLTTTMAAKSAGMAYKMAGITSRDVDVVQMYDCFTIAVLMTLEDYGFAPKGRVADFVRDGALQHGGALPFNTAGGLLSETGMPGMQLIHEAVRQMRGTATLQVPGAKTGLVSNQGGVMQTHATLVVGQ